MTILPHISCESADFCSLTQVTGWANAECRSYEFENLSGGDEDDAILKETEESCERRKGHFTPVSETEKEQIKLACLTTMKTWLAECERDGVNVKYPRPAEASKGNL